MKELRQENPEYGVLYHLNYWDGALSGVCLWNGKKQYFDVIHEEKKSFYDDWPEWEKYCRENDIEIFDDEDDGEIYYYTDRIFGVYDTPNDVMEILDENHELFRKYVGTHTDYIDGKRGVGARIPLRPDHPEDIGDLRPYDQHDNFYKAERRQANIDIKKWKLIGHFNYPL